MSAKKMLLSFSLSALSFTAYALPLGPEHIPAAALMGHLQALQNIAEQNGNNRAAGTAGHELSGNYIAQKLLAAGYKVELQPFSFSQFTKISAGLTQYQPTEVVFEDGKDFNVMSYSGSGSVMAETTAVDHSLGAGNQATSGCEAEDFAAFPVGHIALIQRGSCNFQQKVDNAVKARASAVIIFNQGNSTDREAVFNGTLGESSARNVPVLAVSYQTGVALAQNLTQVKVVTDTKVERHASFNVIAESKTGNPDNVIMLGAHLDSVTEGPGINDNGTGSVSTLEVALRMTKVKSTNRLRFAWFSAEELGLVGSTRYVESLSDVEKAKIALYINVDMVGSPNYKMSVFDGDGSKFGLKGPEGSDSVELLTHNYLASQGIQSVETQIDGRSDYAAFAAAGITIGGLFTGAEGKKTEEDALAFGGKVGEAYDVCYHSACDNINNINPEALEINANAASFLVLTYGHSTASIKKETKSRAPRYDFPVWIEHEAYFRK